MMTLFFGVGQVADVDDARRCDRQKFASYFQGMLRRGIYLPPAPYEAMFVSIAHSRMDLDATVRAFRQWAQEAH
jgi:glutamate-1-semialdehyde 2,1-aminomutase